jgi:branched-chain amino acid transport system ATP-binding protein
VSGLRVRDLRAAYRRGIDILRGVSLEVAPGRITAVIGPNGAGKSTLLRAVAGLVPVTGGRVELSGREVTGEPPRRLLELGLAFVPQERSVFPGMAVRENLRLGGWLRRREGAWLEERIRALAELFPVLGSRLDAPAGDLSGGEQKIHEVARGLVLEPSVLLLDEPTAGLSPGMVDQVYEEIVKLCRERQVTVLLADQNVRQALGVADHAYVLATGRNDADGTAAEIVGRLDEIVRGWMDRRGSGVTAG